MGRISFAPNCFAASTFRGHGVENLPSPFFAAAAFDIVSFVLKVFEATTKRVVFGFRAFERAF